MTSCQFVALLKLEQVHYDISTADVKHNVKHKYILIETSLTTDRIAVTSNILLSNSPKHANAFRPETVLNSIIKDLLIS